MTPTTTQTKPGKQSIKSRVSDMISSIQSGKIIEAMNEFYHTDTVMQENRNDPHRGLETNIKREKEFLGQVKEFHGYNATAIGIDEDKGVALVESWMEFTSTEGKKVRLEQVSVQQWREGKIAHERFYYDPSSK